MFTGKDFRLAASPSDTHPRPRTQPDVYAHCCKPKRAESLQVTLRRCTSLGAWALHFREPRVLQTHAQYIYYRAHGHLGAQCCAVPRHPQRPSTPVSSPVQSPAAWLCSSALCLGSSQWLQPEGGKVSSECHRTLR